MTTDGSSARAGRGSALRRLLTTPFGPPIVPRFPSRIGPRQIIAAAELPASLGTLVAFTVARTRLWHSERRDVAKELCAHFADGLAAGRTAEQLAGEFGDPFAAAKLIRRAKKRNRPLLWRAWVRSVQATAAALVLCVAVYGLLAIRYYTAKPNPSHDYLHEIVAPLLMAPESDRAWPLYREAALKTPKRPQDAQWSRWGAIMPGDPEWAGVEGYLAAAGEALSLARQAAAKPSLGVDLAKEESVPPMNWAPEEELSKSLRVGYINNLSRLAGLLHEDGLGAAGVGDEARLAADLTAIIRTADHAREGPMSVCTASAHSILSTHASRLTLQILARYPTVLRDVDLVDLAHRLGTFAGAGPLLPNTARDRAYLLDLLQRTYTDDGKGDGRITPAGRAYLQPKRDGPRTILTRLSDAARPLTAAVEPSRKDVLAAYDRAAAVANQISSTPLYLRQRDPYLAAVETLGPELSHEPGLRYILPLWSQLSHSAEVTTQFRDAALVAIALELFKRSHGAFPAALSELTPEFLPVLPIDRFDGKPIKYTLRAGRPLLYSVGADGSDDGGKLNTDPNGNRDASAWLAPGSAPGRDGRALRRFDWILYPVVEYDADGGVVSRP